MKSTLLMFAVAMSLSVAAHAKDAKTEKVSAKAAPAVNAKAGKVGRGPTKALPGHPQPTNSSTPSYKPCTYDAKGAINNTPCSEKTGKGGQLEYDNYS
jgi:hypothetical protein